jgi:hypothetical protein
VHKSLSIFEVNNKEGLVHLVNPNSTTTYKGNLTISLGTLPFDKKINGGGWIPVYQQEQGISTV